VVLLPQLCSPCKFSSFSCAFLFVLAWTCIPAVAQERDACSPSPEVKAAFEALPKQTPADTEWDYHQKLIAAIQDLLRKYPSDFFVQKQYVSAMDTPTDRANVIEEYKGKRASSSDSAEILYLYGMALLGRQSPESIKLFSAALETNPKFPWPHLGLASIYGSPIFQDKAKQKQHVVAFLNACPDIRDGYKALTEIDDKPVMREWAAQLRTRLAKRSDKEALSTYATLWSLEFKAAPPSEYDSLRKRTAQDVQRIRALDLKTTEWYRALVEGYKVADDQKTSDQIRDEWISQSDLAIYSFVLEHWFKNHPQPASEADAATRRAYYEALLKQSKKWTQERPNTAFLWNYRLEALVELDGPAGDIEDAATKELDVAKKSDGPDGPYSYEWLNVAGALSEKHLQPERVLEWAEKGLAQLETEKKYPPYDLYATKDNLAERKFGLASEEVWGIGYLIEANLQLKELDRAQVDLMRLDERLQDLKSLAGDKQDKKKDYLSSLSGYWGRMARLAELQSRKLDAMSFYENALLARLDAEQKPKAGHPDELAEDAKKLWASLGGTEAGWTMWYGRRADELARSNSLRWEEANETLPAFELTDMNGKTWNLEALRGKVTFLNFWASW